MNTKNFTKFKLQIKLILIIVLLSFPFNKLYAVNGILTVALSPDTPAPATIISNVYTAFTKINLTASIKDISVSKIEITRTGKGNDAAFKSVSLVDADNKCSFGITKKLINGKATFNETIVIKAGQTRSIYLAGNTASSLTGYAGETPTLSLTSIEIDRGSEVKGTLPITGNALTLNSTIRQLPGMEDIYGFQFNPPSQCPIEIASIPVPVSTLSVIANDPLIAYQEYLESIKIENAWSLTKGSPEVVVAVIDDGIYINHPDLRDNIWVNKSEIIGNNIDDDKNGYKDDIYGWDFISNNGEMTTRGTHGTMVGGIIGAIGNNNIGVSGINWRVKLMPLIACSSKGCETDAIIKAVKYAVDNGANIINLSLSSQMTTGYSNKFDESIKYAFNKNVLIVAAVGNGDVEGGIGQDLNLIPQSPVCNDGGKNMIIGVGATDPEYNTRTPWSNFGTNCVDVYAPGTGLYYKIVSTAVPAYSSIEGFYDSGEGTSFSAPIVSGIAALIRAKYPTIKNTAIQNRIINNSDYQNGLRIINAYRAVSQTFGDNENNSNNISNSNSESQNTNDNTTKKDQKSSAKIDKILSKKLTGKLLLQVEQGGAIWYVDTKEFKRYSVTWANALPLFVKLSLGITDANLVKIPITGSDEVGSWSMRNRLKGKLLLQVQQGGAIWYIDNNGYRHSVTWNNLMELFTKLSLGITNANLDKIQEGSLE